MLDNIGKASICTYREKKNKERGKGGKPYPCMKARWRQELLEIDSEITRRLLNFFLFRGASFPMKVGWGGGGGANNFYFHSEFPQGVFSSAP